MYPRACEGGGLGATARRSTRRRAPVLPTPSGAHRACRGRRARSERSENPLYKPPSPPPLPRRRGAFVTTTAGNFGAHRDVKTPSSRSRERVGVRAAGIRSLWLPRAPPPPAPVVARCGGEDRRDHRVQRTSSDLRLNPHLHVVFLDGAYAERGAELVWESLSHLKMRHVGEVLERAVARMTRFLRRRSVLAVERQ